MNKVLHRKITLTINLRILGLVLLAGVILVAVFILRKPAEEKITIKKEDSSPLAVLADKVINSCEKSSNRQDCYNLKIPELTSSVSMEDAFKVAGLVQSKDSSYAYLHVLAHKLSSREVAKNPKEWIDVLSRCPSSGIGSNGCLHGALQERFRSATFSETQIEQIIPDLRIACEKRNSFNPTSLAQSVCYHGLGHLTVYLTSADFEKSIAICKKIAFKDDGRDFSRVCFEGLFMQLFQPLETEDTALVKDLGPSKENLRSFCEKFIGIDVVEACYRQGWPLYKEEINTPKGVEVFCQKASSSEQIDNCYQTMFYIAGQGNNFDSKKITAFCNGLTVNLQGNCFSDASLSMVLENQSNGEKAVALCKEAGTISSESESSCFKALVNNASSNFNIQSAAYTDFCRILPDSYKQDCLEFKK